MLASFLVVIATFAASYTFADRVLGATVFDTTYALALSCSVLIVYILISAAFAALDTTGTLQARKVQKDACTDPRLYAEIAMDVLVLLLVVATPTLCLMVWTLRWRNRRFPRFPKTGWVTFGLSLLIMYLVSDFVAWGVHKGLHKGALWDHVHAKHHDVVAPIAVSSLYAHPVEVVCWDMLPFFLGPLLLGIDAPTFFAVSIVAIVNTLLVHSGYDVFYDDGHHDLHHERLKCNYSSRLSDAVMGTLLVRERDAVYPRFDKSEKDLTETIHMSCQSLHGDHPR